MNLPVRTALLYQITYLRWSFLTDNLLAQTRHGQPVISYDDILRFLREDQRHLLREEGQSPNQGLLSGGEAE